MKALIVSMSLLMHSVLVSAQLPHVQQSEVTSESGVSEIRLQSDGSLFTGIVVSNYENVRPQRWKEVKGGKANGLWMEWYENGNLRFKANWQEGRGHGLWQYFHENGQVRDEGVYHYDIPNGIHQEYHANGQLAVRKFYIDGKKEGKWEYFNSEGLPEKTEQQYHLGEMIGESQN